MCGFRRLSVHNTASFWGGTARAFHDNTTHQYIQFGNAMRWTRCRLKNAVFCHTHIHLPHTFPTSRRLSSFIHSSSNISALFLWRVYLIFFGESTFVSRILFVIISIEIFNGKVQRISLSLPLPPHILQLHTSLWLLATCELKRHI